MRSTSNLSHPRARRRLIRKTVELGWIMGNHLRALEDEGVVGSGEAGRAGLEEGRVGRGGVGWVITNIIITSTTTTNKKSDTRSK